MIMKRFLLWLGGQLFELAYRVVWATFIVVFNLAYGMIYAVQDAGKD